MHAIDDILYYGQFVLIGSFIAGIIGMPFLVRATKKESDVTTKELAYSIIAVAQVFLVWFSFYEATDYMQQEARKEVLELLKREDLRIFVYHSQLTDRTKEVVLHELLHLKKIDAHHSSPTDAKIITLKCGNEQTNLILKEDSNVKNEYWVFWDKYRSTTKSEIGRIRSEQIERTLTKNGDWG
ncbi:MAG: hypothetical protein IPO05_05850 [Flavobacteriales bacterium]|jgi:PIN domain nuclease of toxin-antitoxin system|nr:hypothetical protein [Flavobacteriales bacterium]